MPTRTRITGFAVVLGISCSAGTASSAAQSLADLARKEQARRKQVVAPGKVYTNADLRSLPPLPDPPPRPASPPPPAPGTPGVEAVIPAPEAAAASAARDENYWRSRMTASRLMLERNRLLFDSLTSRINALTTDFINRDDPAERALLAQERQNALAEQERMKLEIQRLLKEISVIEDEARRAGVPPGWLR